MWIEIGDEVLAMNEELKKVLIKFDKESLDKKADIRTQMSLKIEESYYLAIIINRTDKTVILDMSTGSIRVSTYQHITRFNICEAIFLYGIPRGIGSCPDER